MSCRCTRNNATSHLGQTQIIGLGRIISELVGSVKPCRIREYWRADRFWCSGRGMSLHVETIDWSRWEPTERANLCFVIRDGQILLIRKKRGLGAGKMNGPGGRLEAGETALAA